MKTTRIINLNGINQAERTGAVFAACVLNQLKFLETVDCFRLRACNSL